MTFVEECEELSIEESMDRWRDPQMNAPDVLVRFAEEAGTPLVPDSDGSGLSVGESEVRHEVVRDAGGRTLVVQEYHRGAPPRTVLRTDDPEVVWRFLALVIATVWRSRHGLDVLVLAKDELPSGYEVVPTGPRRVLLRWASGSADELREYQARHLAHACAHTLDEVVAAVRHPTGWPVSSDEPAP